MPCVVGVDRGTGLSDVSCVQLEAIRHANATETRMKDSIARRGHFVVRAWTTPHVVTKGSMIGSLTSSRIPAWIQRDAIRVRCNLAAPSLHQLGA